MAEAEPREIFMASRLIICEGASDCRFLTLLLERRQITGFQVVRPANSKDGFENRLRVIRASEDDLAKIETIVLITDNDDDPAAAFNRIARQVRQAGQYPIPAQPLTVARKTDYPDIVIVMIPWEGIEGGLETLILEALADKEPDVRKCLEEYLNCTPARDWNSNKQAKMLLVCMIAGICKGNPAGSLTYLWNTENNLLDLIDHSCFDRLANFLSGL
jgi:hypothetical protein